MISASFKPKEPHTIVMEMTVSMTINEWRELYKLLPTVYPAWQFASKITDLILQAEKHYYASEEEQP